MKDILYWYRGYRSLGAPKWESLRKAILLKWVLDDNRRKLAKIRRLTP